MTEEAGQYWDGAGQYWAGAGQYWDEAGQYWDEAGQYWDEAAEKIYVIILSVKHNASACWPSYVHMLRVLASLLASSPKTKRQSFVDALKRICFA